MIRLLNGVNNVALTLKEKTTISNPTYLFEFINNQSQKKVYCISLDTSIYKDRYNEFVITVTTTPTPLNGDVNLVLGDEYTYNVYQQSSTTNLNPALSGAIVETGLMTYDKNETIRAEFTTTETRAVYEG